MFLFRWNKSFKYCHQTLTFNQIFPMYHHKENKPIYIYISWNNNDHQGGKETAIFMTECLTMSSASYFSAQICKIFLRENSRLWPGRKRLFQDVMFWQQGLFCQCRVEYWRSQNLKVAVIKVFCHSLILPSLK